MNEEGASSVAVTSLHRDRNAILHTLAERQVASSGELASATGIPRSSVNEHLRLLEGQGYLECFERRPKRGALEHVYRPTGRSLIAEDPELAKLTRSQRVRLTLTILRNAMKDAAEAISARGTEHPDAEVYSHARALVDRQGWSELAVIHRRAVEEMLEVRRRSAERLRSGGSAIRTTSAIFFFELPTSSPAPE